MTQTVNTPHKVTLRLQAAVQTMRVTSQFYISLMLKDPHPSQSNQASWIC